MNKCTKCNKSRFRTVTKKDGIRITVSCRNCGMEMPVVNPNPTVVVEPSSV